MEGTKGRREKRRNPRRSIVLYDIGRDAQKSLKVHSGLNTTTAGQLGSRHIVSCMAEAWCAEVIESASVGIRWLGSKS